MPIAGGLWYEWHGPETGEVVILSPGLGGSAGYWDPNVAAFAERFRVLLYDHRGTGRSDRTLLDGLAIADMADDVCGLMDALGIERAHFVGHALGGIIGLALAHGAPDRVDRLAVINGWARLDPYTARCFDVRLALLRDSGPEAYLRAQPIFLYPADWCSAYSEWLDEQAAEQLLHFPGRENVERRIAALRGFDATPLLPSIAGPTLVLSTSDDMLVPWHVARDLCELLPNASRCLQFSGGHAASFVEPMDFHDRVLPWLAGDEIEEE